MTKTGAHRRCGTGNMGIPGSGGQSMNQIIEGGNSQIIAGLDELLQCAGRHRRVEEGLRTYGNTGQSYKRVPYPVYLHISVPLVLYPCQPPATSRHVCLVLRPSGGKSFCPAKTVYPWNGSEGAARQAEGPWRCHVREI